jgi:hypothetical protein
MLLARSITALPTANNANNWPISIDTTMNNPMDGVSTGLTVTGSGNRATT